MCTVEQHREKMTALERVESLLRGRNPDDLTIKISDTQGWQINYRGYKHIFMWIPGNALTINFGEYGQGTVQSQVWINLGMRAGREIFTSGQSTPVSIIFRFTDEDIP